MSSMNTMMNWYNSGMKTEFKRYMKTEFLQVSINNQIIFINRKEAYTGPNSSTKSQTIK
jgi:hypothetical protein